MTTAMKTKYPWNWMFSEQKRGCLHALRTLHAPHVRFSLWIHFFDVPLGTKNRDINSTEVVQPWQWQRQRYESMLWLDEWWQHNRGTRAVLLLAQFSFMNSVKRQSESFKSYLRFWGFHSLPLHENHSCQARQKYISPILHNVTNMK